MPQGLSPPPNAVRAVNAFIDQALARLAVVWIPLAVALFTVVAWWAWPDQYTASPTASLTFRVIEETGDPFTPESARDALNGSASPVPWTDTRLSEQPFWVKINLPTAPMSEGDVVGRDWIDLPSRHATRVRCWDADTLTMLGEASRRTQTGALRPFRAGFALMPGTATELLCRIESVGPARISLQTVEQSAFISLDTQYHRMSGLLDGGILMLALFTAMAGLINRNTTYVLFAAWLVVNMRMAALSMGWDHQWLGFLLPADILYRSRLVTVALYAAVTFTLFAELFKQELKALKLTALASAVKAACGILLLLSLLLPFQTFLPIAWVTTALGSVALIYLLTRVIVHRRTPVAHWYAASLAVGLLASVSELVGAAFGLKEWLGTINSVTAALASSLLASLAIAEQMRQAQRQKLSAQAELQHTYNVIPIGLFATDLEGRFTNANPALLRMLGSHQSAAIDRLHWNQFFSAQDWHALLDRSASDSSVEIELSLRRDDGLRHFLVQATRTATGTEGTLQDITEKAQATENLKFLANHDPLTKVLNRRGIERILTRGIHEIARGHVMAVAYLDLDRFKLINDLYGHAAGDAVLQTVCERIQVPLSERMFVGRVGGDEFLIVMTRTSLSHAETICRRLLESLESSPCQVGDRAFQIRGSMGLIEVAQGIQSKDVVSLSDHACRMAKKRQNGGLVTFDRSSGLLTAHEAELELIERLATHQSIDGLFLEMQPIMSLRAPYASLNFEVLLRMQNEAGERIPTERLIHAAEHAGRMSVIDRWVLSHTLEWLSAHRHSLQPQHFVCMNLSGASLNDERFVDDVFAMLERHREVAHTVCLEITESVALHDMNNTRRFIDRVRSVGAKVALDDFGAGYTSFSYLKDLPADLLKIDGSFIVNMNRHPANIAIVEAIVSLAQNLGMKTIAEWAEDFETVETLAQIGVDYVQGFVVARPQHPDIILRSPSAGAFIVDTSLKHYLSDLTVDELEHVDLILGGDEPQDVAKAPRLPF